jgi:iron complex transport system substrate-binding protein
MCARGVLEDRVRAPLRSLFLALALAGACRESAQPVTAPAELRVVSLSPAITEILVALGVRERIVGVDRLSRDVPGCAEIPALGGLFAPDLERTLELRPTVVLGVLSESQAAFFAQLRARGIAVHEIDTGGSLEAVMANYEKIGAIVGRAAEGRALDQRVMGEIEHAVEGAPRLPQHSVALVVERDPLYVAGGGSFASELIEAANGRNVFADLPRAYPQVSLELLAERAPDVLIDSTQTEQSPEAIAAARAYWSRFAWVKRVELLPPGVTTLPGTRLGQAAELLAKCIHPELRQ